MASRLLLREGGTPCLKHLLTSIATITFVGLTSLPAAAQVSVAGQRSAPRSGDARRAELSTADAKRAQAEPPGQRLPVGPGLLALAWQWLGLGSGPLDRPDAHGVKWVKARYQHEGSAYVYQPGHWSNQQLIEGDDYRNWQAEKHSKKGHDKHSKNK